MVNGVATSGGGSVPGCNKDKQGRLNSLQKLIILVVNLVGSVSFP